MMNKLLLSMLGLIVFSTMANAAPCYGPRMPHQKQIHAGVESYTIYHRDLEDNFGKIRSQQQFVLLSYGLYDWLSIDFKGGSGDIRSYSNTSSDIHYKPFLAGGYGVRFRLYSNEVNKVVFGFQHISNHPWSKHLGAVKHKSVLDDWQFSLLGSHDLKWMTPYVGTRFSWMNQIHWQDRVRKLEKSDLGKSVGLILGTDVPIGKKMWINIEGQFLDATALAASVNLAF
jgi:hypothetical protein